jgi:hypothetical protein
MAFFCAEEPDALSEPETQLASPVGEADEPPSEPHAASARTPATASAARRAVREMVTLVLQESWSMCLTLRTVGSGIDRIGRRG